MYLILVLVVLAIAIGVGAVRRQRQNEWINRRGEELRQQRPSNDASREE